MQHTIGMLFVLFLLCLRMSNFTAFRLTKMTQENNDQEETTKVYPKLPEVVKTLHVGTLIHPQDLSDESSNEAYQIVNEEYGRGSSSSTKEEKEPSRGDGVVLQDALKHFQADFDKATMTLIGYKGKKKEQINQDRAVIVSPYLWRKKNETGEEELDGNNNSNKDFLIGVFDGHGEGGEVVSEYTATTLPKLLAFKLQSLVEQEDGNNNDGTQLKEKDISNAIHETFVELDQTSPPDSSYNGGCTATIIMRCCGTDKLFVANAGDSRGLVATINSATKESKIHYITREDKPHLPDELKRIQSEPNPGQVSIPPKGTSRVLYYNPKTGQRHGLAMSRSIGDWNVGQYGVIPDPIIEVLDIQELIEKEKAANKCINSIRDSSRDDNTCKNPQEGEIGNKNEDDNGTNDINNNDPVEVGLYVATGSDGLFDFLEPIDIASAAAQGFFSFVHSDGTDLPTQEKELPSPSSFALSRHPLATCGELVIAAVKGWNSKHQGRYRDDIAIAIQKVYL